MASVVRCRSRRSRIPTRARYIPASSAIASSVNPANAQACLYHGHDLELEGGGLGAPRLSVQRRPHLCLIRSGREVHPAERRCRARVGPGRVPGQPNLVADQVGVPERQGSELHLEPIAVVRQPQRWADPLVIDACLDDDHPRRTRHREARGRRHLNNAVRRSQPKRAVVFFHDVRPAASRQAVPRRQGLDRSPVAAGTVALDHALGDVVTENPDPTGLRWPEVENRTRGEPCASRRRRPPVSVPAQHASRRFSAAP